MADRCKIVAICVLVLVFASVFMLSLKWRNKNLPLVTFCCQEKESCADLKEISAKEINSKSSHDTKYKVIKAIVVCDTGNYEINEFFMKKV